jgi:galactosamine-6-phosphate isomerase
MKIHVCPDYKAMSQKAADLVHLEIGKKPNLLFCVASGGSPSGLYELMVKKHLKNPEFFNKIRMIKLDEWVGLPAGSEFSSEYDVQQKLLQQIDIPAYRYIAFDDQTSDPDGECKRIQTEIEQSGPIDICILGIGQNGHIALNEPNSKLQLDCHVAALSERTLSSGMIEKVGIPLKEGMTIGLGGIMASKMVILLISGKGKKEAFDQLMTKEINPELPASMLWLHPNAYVIVNETSV